MDKSNFTWIAEIPTLLDGTGGLDLPAMQRIADRLKHAGYDRVCVAGSAGEYAGLSLATQQTLLHSMQERADGLALLSGALDAGTAKVCERIQAHRALGYHTHLVLPAYFFGLSHPREILRHVERLLETGSRLILLDSPAHVRFSLPEEVFAELAALPGVEAVCSDRRLTGQGFADETGVLYTGDAALLLGMGGAGCISRLAFLFPKLMRYAAEDGVIPQHVLEAMLYLRRGTAHPAAALKVAARLLGLCENDVLLAPALPVELWLRKRIEEAVRVIAPEEEKLAHA